MPRMGSYLMATKKSKNLPENTKPNVGGRPRFIIDYRQLSELCKMQCTGEECAAIVGCSYETLNNRMKQDYSEAIEQKLDLDQEFKADGFLEYSRHYANYGRASLRQAQFKKAIKDGDGNMQRWLGKQYLNQADKKETSISGFLNDYTDLDGDDLDRKIREMNQMLASSQED